MLYKKFLQISCLLLMTLIVCSMLSCSPPATQTDQPYNLDDELTHAIQTYQAESAENPSQTPSPEDNSLTVLGKHHVAAGETLECIGRGYGVLPEAIAGFNHIDPNAELQIGQVLEIPAIRWTDIPAGSTCPAQFVIPNWELSSDEKPQTASTPTAKTQPTKLIIVSTQPHQVFDEPTRTLQVTPRPFDTPTEWQEPVIQKPPPGITLPTWTPLPPPPPAPPPTNTSIPITPLSLPPCFPLPCLPPIPPFP